MSREATIASLVKATAAMRAAQQAYDLATRKNRYCGHELDRKRAAETQVDQLLAALGDKTAASALQGALFGET